MSEIRKWEILAIDFEDEEYTLSELFIGDIQEVEQESKKLAEAFEETNSFFLATIFQNSLGKI